MAAPAPRDPAEFNFENIIYVKDGRRATITINRPAVLNCVNLPTLRELQQAFLDASWDDTLAVVVLTGAGDRAFCTGADLKEQQADYVDAPSDYWKWMGEFCRAHELLRAIGKPTVARLNGIVVGGGNEFNMSCDLAVACDDIYIKQVGAAMGSVAAAGATQWLPLIVGDRRAREILMLCDEIPAAQALDWGLVNRVVPRERLDAEVDDMCARLSAKLPECMRYTKQQLNFWKDFSWSMTIGHARDWLSIHNRATEVHAGVEAFNDKRRLDYDALRPRP